MKKNVFVAGILMAAAIVAGFGGMTNGTAPMLRAEAASVQNADSAVNQLIAEQNQAEQNALDYVGAGYTIVSTELTSGKADSREFKIGVAPKSNRSKVLYLNVNHFYCIIANSKNETENAQYFADKRTAEANVISKLGKSFQIVSSEPVASGSTNTFKIGVTKTGTSKVTYYYAGNGFCKTEKEWTASASSDGSQNPIMNFIGKYSNGRAMMTVFAKGNDKAAISITWSSSAAAHSEWTMTGKVRTIGDCIIVDYSDCVKESICYNTNGTVAEDIIEYTNGSGSLTFHGNDVIWTDGVENITDGTVFSWYN